MAYHQQPYLCCFLRRAAVPARKPPGRWPLHQHDSRGAKVRDRCVCYYIYTDVYLHALSVKMYKTHLQRTSAYDIIWCTILYIYIQLYTVYTQYIAVYIYAYNIYKALSYFGKTTTICHHLQFACGPLTSPQQTWPLELRRGHCPEGDPLSEVSSRQLVVRGHKGTWCGDQTASRPCEHVMSHDVNPMFDRKTHVKYMEIPMVSPVFPHLPGEGL